MTDQSPFAPFAPQSPAPAEPLATDKKRKRSKASTASVAALPDAVPPEPRAKRRKPTPAARAAKYDLQTILRIASTLKDGDQKVFEKLLGELSALAKGSRERVLMALGEVFG